MKLSTDIECGSAIAEWEQIANPWPQAEIRANREANFSSFLFSFTEILFQFHDTRQVSLFNRNQFSKLELLDFSMMGFPIYDPECASLSRSVNLLDQNLKAS